MQESKQKSLYDAKEYLRKHQLFDASIKNTPANDLGLILVIPAYNEPDIQPLESLIASAMPDCSVEILVVFNASQNTPPGIKEINRSTARRIRSICLPPWLRLHVLEYNNLSDHSAGVGLARKIGMDEAINRFIRAGQTSGVIASLDADCYVSENYLVSLVEFFEVHLACPAATVYFEHQRVALEPATHAAITEYELFLRCYVQGLRCSSYPGAFYTIGSCMAVRARDYVRRGGMNKRKAGEDFYFLHKLAALGAIGEITTCVVYPSSRASDRTPFGTGHVVQKNQTQLTYATEIFADLGSLIACVSALRQHDPMILGLPEAVNRYCSRAGFLAGLNIVRQNTASDTSFRKRFFQWFDGLQVLKFVHCLSDQEYPRVPVRIGALSLLKHMGFDVDMRWNSEVLLDVFRRIDRGHS